MDISGRPGHTPSAGASALGSDTSGNLARGVRASVLRRWHPASELCRDHQHSGPEVSIPEKLSSRALEAFNNVGRTVARESSSSDACAVAEGLGGHSIALKVQDCLLSTDTDCADVIFLRLKLVKSRTRGARMQSVRLDVPFVVHFLKKCFAVMQPDEQIWSFSAATLRRRLQQTLQVVAGHSDLCLPSSLRPGGATYWFRVWQEDLPRLQWRGRWLHFKNLAHYIQEVGCVNVMEQVTPAFRLKIQSLAALSEAACKEYVVKADLCSQVQRLLGLLHKQQEIQRPTPM